ncbi:uncharacterized protein [Kogia breviceps]|uniref:uncharacterized protein isoform X1 n=1 Tax=Kogia breviceps TaxID=27615 RepID=UPI0034D18EA4
MRAGPGRAALARRRRGRPSSRRSRRSPPPPPSPPRFLLLLLLLLPPAASAPSTRPPPPPSRSPPPSRGPGPRLPGFKQIREGFRTGDYFALDSVKDQQYFHTGKSLLPYQRKKTNKTSPTTCYSVLEN